MILHQLRAQVEQSGRVSRRQLARQFGLTEDGVDAMMALWQRKGVIGQERVGCRSVDCCQPFGEVWYRLLKPDELPVTVIRE
ncbi:FeoC-like transcriptional regulator [Photobacterium sp. 1_MG-2023]|uniref:FeoC-like transcriptional regulator n=1 Tax=Photobacterium sp. 1_MG-2023 TaxID=3062646 RepID=UPI0026E2A47F|nr:FeoC-like transcriptional regulator [Photobacterium sp. 1_MG-2023]MDO6705731.1 FeoC-like transcriptional regulator [Photobacterium sp. 1_MG-2023]